MYLQVADRYRKLHRELSVGEDTYIHVFAPVLIEFVKWVLITAVSDGRARLYFLSRDGYQMYLVAKKLTKVYGIDIDCRYLNVSRYALRLPEYHLIQEKCLDRICVGGIDVTFEKVMKRAGLDDNESKEIAKLCCFLDNYREVLSYRQVMSLKEVLREKGNFFEYVYRHSIQSYGTTMAYLKQEGLFEDISYALVDSGWIGTLHQTLNNLLKSGGKEGNIDGYYFGLYETPKGCRQHYKAYFFEPEGDIARKVNFSNCLFEAVYTSTEGMTLRYERESDRVNPVFDNRENINKEFVQKNIMLLREYMDIYCQETIECANMSNGSMAIMLPVTQRDTKLFVKVTQKMLGKLLKNMMGSPSEEEVAVYGNILFSDDVLENNLQKVAAELSDKEISNQRFLNKMLIMLGMKKDVIHESAWMEGSIVRNGKKVKVNLKHVRLYKYFVYIRKRFR